MTLNSYKSRRTQWRLLRLPSYRLQGVTYRMIWTSLVVFWFIMAANVAIFSRTFEFNHPPLAKQCYSPITKGEGGSGGSPEGGTETGLALFSLQNHCCQLLHYSAAQVRKCAIASAGIRHGDRKRRAFSSYLRGPNEYLLSFRSHRQKRGHTHSVSSKEIGAEVTLEHGASSGRAFVFIGDSHVRQVFGALVTLLSEQIMCRSHLTKWKWGDCWSLRDELLNAKIHYDVEVKELKSNLRLVFIWDPFWKKLLKFNKEWNLATNANELPLLVLTGSGLHWMKESVAEFESLGAKEAAKPFLSHLADLKSGLVTLAKNVPIYVRAIGHFQESSIYPKFKGVYSSDNIDLYNGLLKDAFKGTWVLYWDSSLVVSDAYLKECEKDPERQTEDKFWNCRDVLHVGYVVTNVVLNILLNDFCNDFIVQHKNNTC